MTAYQVPARCVGGIVRDADGKLLLVRRAHEPGKGLWSLPGGRVEPGEDDAAALRREMAEETGLDVRPGALAGTVERGTYDIYDYTCAVVGGTTRAGDDAAEVRWVDASEFARLDHEAALTPHLADTLRDWGLSPWP